MSSRPDPYALVGEAFRGRYSLQAFVGVGRFSAVYRATDEESGAPVAVRLLRVRPTLVAIERADVLRRLGALAAAVQAVAEPCPTFAGALDVGAVAAAEGRWLPGIVHPWLDGETLENVLQEERRRAAPPRALARAIELMSPVADALAYAHGCGVVHGGLAPRNVFVRHGAALDVLDLGMSGFLGALQAELAAFAAREEGPVSFSPAAYASPEHFMAARAPGKVTPPGAPADVFSLALMMVELLTGRAPLGEGDDSQLEAAAFDASVRPTPRVRGRDLGGYVDAIFERALAVNPADRHGTVASFWSALRAASRLTLRASSSAIISPEPPRDAEPPAREELPTRAAMRSSPPQSERPTPAHPPRAALAEDTRSPASAPARAPSPSLTDEACTSSARTRAVAIYEPEGNADDALAVGETIAGKYSIERLLGRGGMGAVWLCTHLGLGERVAVKVMSKTMADNPEIRARFAREARASARIKSRYVARVFDTGELPDLRPYIVMEFMEGETLAQALRGAKAMALEDTVRILAQVGRGLARAHELGIIHRDVKPDNVFLAHTADDGVVAKVFDFGIVKVAETANDGATREGVLIGTPHYMSPEQADGMTIDQRSDIYSLGVMAFRMLTGKRLFEGDSIMNVLLKICSAPLPSLAEHAPGIPPSVGAWFRRTCARDRESRFRTAIECVDALARAAGMDGVRESVLPPPPTAAKGKEGSEGSDVTPEPHELSCPTLLDEIPGALDDEPDDDFFLLVKPKVGTAGAGRTERRSTNPLFAGESDVGRSTAPSTMEARGAAARRASRWRRVLAFGAIVVGAAVGTVGVTHRIATTSGGGEVRPAAAPPERPADPPPVARPAPSAPLAASAPPESAIGAPAATGAASTSGDAAAPAGAHGARTRRPAVTSR